METISVLGYTPTDMSYVLHQFVAVWVVERASNALKGDIAIRLVLNGDDDIVPLAINDVWVSS